MNKELILLLISIVTGICFPAYMLLFSSSFDILSKSRYFAWGIFMLIPQTICVALKLFTQWFDDDEKDRDNSILSKLYGIWGIGYIIWVLVLIVCVILKYMLIRKDLQLIDDYNIQYPPSDPRPNTSPDIDECPGGEMTKRQVDIYNLYANAVNSNDSVSGDMIRKGLAGTDQELIYINPKSCKPTSTKGSPNFRRRISEQIRTAGFRKLYKKYNVNLDDIRHDLGKDIRAGEALTGVDPNIWRVGYDF